MKYHINSFSNEAFGSLTTIRNPINGNIMFPAKEIQALLGIKNLRDSKTHAGLTDKEYIVVKLKDYPNLKKQLCRLNLHSHRSPSFTVISESGLYKLILISRKQEAQSFRDWVAEEVLPSIRNTGKYDFKNIDIQKHTKVENQKQNSKDVNHLHYFNGGVKSVIEYNRTNCVEHTGKRPSEIKKWGESIGLKSRQRTSAKEVLRNTFPEKACSMSFADELVNNGVKEIEAIKASKHLAEPLFKKILELGFIPKQLHN